MKVADCLTSLAQLHEHRGARDEAQLAYEEALAVAEEALGAEHLDTGGKLLDLATFLSKRGRYDAADPLFRRATLIAEHHFGPRSTTFARFLSHVADHYEQASRDVYAAELYERAVSILEDHVEDEPDELAAALNNLGLIHFESGRLMEAESVLARALSLRESVLGKEHIDIAVSLHNLALVRESQGDYVAVEDSVVRALAIKLAQPSPDVVSIARSRELLAGALRELERYDEAEAQIDQALRARRARQGPGHPELAESLDGLAMILLARGARLRAEALFEEALVLRSRAVPPDPEMMATSAIHLADLHGEIGDYDEACTVLERVAATVETSWGPDHPALSRILHGLGMHQLRKGSLARAERMLMRALSIAEASFGPDHLVVAQALDALGSLHLQGSARVLDAAERARLLSQAEAYHGRALHIRMALLGPEDPLVGESLNNIGTTHWRRGALDEALDELQRALAIVERTRAPNHPALVLPLGNLALLLAARGNRSAARSTLRRMLEIEEYNLSRTLWLADDGRRMAYASTYLGSTLVTLSLHLQTAADDRDTARLAATTLLRRKGRTQELLMESQALLRRSLPPEQQPRLDELSSLRSRYAMLARVIREEGPSIEASSAIDEVRRRQSDVLAALVAPHSPSEPPTLPVSLEAVRRALPPESVLIEFAYYFSMFDGDGSLVPRPDSARYAVYVISPDGLDWVDLGPASAIESLVEGFRRDLLLGVDERAAGRALFDAVMAPLAARLADARTLFIAPDGVLNQVPFGALYDGRYLIERHEVHYLSSGRDLLRPWRTDVTPRDTVVAIVNPTGAGLPGTDQEAELLEGMFSAVSVLRGDGATETRALKQRNPWMLHMATHGFFATAPADQWPAWAPRSSTGVAWIDDLVASPLDDPMIHSGLSMAVVSVPVAEPSSDDGSLTAFEISGWDLRGTQLVTLSGCDTGLGQPEIGEGVFGLRRAFAIAGAQTQVMSLWKVSDGATPAVMAAYYRHLAAGHGRSEAMRRAQLQMLRSRDHHHPRHWASFIVSGEWAPLEFPAGQSPRVEARGCGRNSIGANEEGGVVPWSLLCMLAMRRRRSHPSVRTAGQR